jgi:hypothetical protein
MSNSSAQGAKATPRVTEIDISALGFKKIRTSWIRNELVVGLFGFSFYVGIMSAVGFPVLGIQLPEFAGATLALLSLGYLLVLLVKGLRRGFGNVRSLGKEAGQASTMLVPYIGVPLGKAKERIERYFAASGAPAKVAASPRAAARSLGYLLGAIALGGVALFAGVLAGQAAGRLGPLAVGGVAGAFILLLLRRGAMSAQPSATDVLVSDQRPPILLLRAFTDDTLIVDQRVKVLVDMNAAIRLEEAMAASLSAYGPFVAIGAPDEPLPQLGAARAYLGKDEWQEAVQRWIGAARFIVMVVGVTEWLRWELKQIVARQRVGDLILVLPPPQVAVDQAGLKQRWDNAVTSFASTPWHDALRDVPVVRTLALSLRPDGTVLAVTGSGRLMQDYETATLVLLYARFCQGQR